MAIELLKPDCTVLVVVDVQGRLARLMHESGEMIRNQRILIEGCRILEIPVVWTEQVPEKLGPTVDELKEKLEGIPLCTKTSFSCYADPAFNQVIADAGRDQVILCGIETHVCVWQTAAHLKSAGFEVFVAADAVGSRNPHNKEIGLRRMSAEGIRLTNVEMALFELMVNAKHLRFREITALLK